MTDKDRALFHAIAEDLARAALKFEELSKGGEDGEVPPPDDPPSKGPLSQEEIDIVNAVYNTKNEGIQISKVNPAKFGAPIGIMFEEDNPKNGFGESLAEAFKNYSGPISALVPNSSMEVEEQEDWREYLDNTPHATSVRKDQQSRYFCDYYRKSTNSQKEELTSRAGAVAFAIHLPSK